MTHITDEPATVKRYDPCIPADIPGSMCERVDGEYVLYSEIGDLAEKCAALERAGEIQADANSGLRTELLAARAEVARLQGRAVPLSEWQQMEAERDQLREEVARLTTENARLLAANLDILAWQRNTERDLATLTSALEEANVERDDVLLKDRIKTREINVLVEENRAMRANDPRYRWLRENFHVNLLCGFFGNGCVNRRIEEVDAAIDAAIALTQEKRGG